MRTSSMIRNLIAAGGIGGTLAVSACAPSAHNVATTTVTAPPVTVTVTAAAAASGGPGATVPTDTATRVPRTPVAESNGPNVYAVGRPRPGLDRVNPPGSYRMVRIDG
ncbi:MAG: hypothetical protein QOE20_158 [Mycobacterium sp.]|nr:hypothetical protein [Mycobacterium sp.]